MKTRRAVRRNGKKRSAFATRLIEARMAKGLAQQELADEIDVRRKSITQWETDVCMPRAELLFELCRTLEVSADYLLGLQVARRDEDA